MNDAAPANVLHYAGPLSSEPLVLQVVRPLQATDAKVDPTCDVTPSGHPVEIAAHVAEGQVLLTLRVAAAETTEDDELQIAITCRNQSIADCTVILRRTACVIGSALIERGRESVPVRYHTVAALQWYGWRRFSEYVGLKRFTSGRSGSDVMVFRPRLLDPVNVDPSVKDFIPGVLTGGWGSCLLIKTGEARKMDEEWHRFDAFLRDRLHPFMSRLEVRLPVTPALPASTFDEMTEEERTGLTADSPTLVGSFLGGELVEAESFEQLVQHSPDTARCVDVIDRLFAVMHPWYSDAATRPLKDWKKRIRFTDDGKYLLSGKFDFTEQADRVRYREPLAWDVDFISQDHLRKHLLGKEDARDGLLYKLADIECRFSLTHGDLHTRNVLADPDNVWLLDFGEAGPSPTLFDFAKLEVYLRYWCLRLNTGHSDFEQAASDFESLLLDHITGSEASLEPVRRLAPSIGADPDELLRVATCICSVRRHAMRYSLGSPDRRDYLAILYLTVLDVLRFAGQSPREVSNFRLLVNMAWVLEDALSRIMGLTPVERRRHSTRETDHIDREWIGSRGLPGRVHYLMQSHDRGALAPLAATRGVTQSRHHHLNVYDHTLLVIAYLESILDDPLSAFLDPAERDARVRAALLEEGIRLPPFAPHHRQPQKPRLELTAEERTAIEAVFQQCRDADSELVLKTCAIFHDVGKPVSRAVTVKNNGARSVQFLGHEVYSRHLAQEFLDEVYDDPDDASLKERIVHLILSHHGHHDLVNRFSQDESHRKNLDEFTRGGRASKSDWSFLSKFMNPDVTTFAGDFPLQILHGYADMLACRGREQNRFVSVTDVAEIDLRLILLYSRFDEWEQAQKEADAMRIDYTTGGLDLVSSILDANSQRLSRTRGGVSDTSTSAEKERLTVSGNELAEQSRKNEARVHALLFERRDSFNPQGPADVLQLLLEIADGTNDNLLPSNRWRRWDVPSHGEGRDEFSQRALLSAAIPFTSVEAALEEFVQVVFEHWSTLEADPVPLASWAEWQLNAGPLHPFYDGCGRISRLFSAALFLRASWLLPMYDSRETYFERANRGTASFAGYVRERITACQSYLSSNGSFTIVTRQ